MFRIIVISFFFFQYAFAATCPPCICTESTSTSSSESYLQSQIAVLNGYIEPDIQKATENAKSTLEEVKKSYVVILSTEALLTSILKDHVAINQELEKTIQKKEIEIKGKIALIQNMITNNQIRLLEINKEEK